MKSCFSPIANRMSGVTLPRTHWSPRRLAPGGTALRSRSLGQRYCALRMALQRSGGERPYSALPKSASDIFSVSATFGWPGRIASPQPQ